jgi:peptidyl-prolyl cis-trans isomerase C
MSPLAALKAAGLHRAARRALLIAACLALFPRAGAAAEPLPGGPVGSAAALEEALAQFGKSPDMVVAEVDGKPVTAADVIEAIRLLPRVNAEAAFPQIVRQAADVVIARKVLAEKAEAAGLATNPVVRRRIEAAQDRILGQELLTRSLAPNLLEPAVKSTFEARPISKTAVPEVQLRVIAVPTRSEAEDLVRKISDGADFAAVARAASRDSSAAKGGLLDYHWKETLAPALGAIGFSMDVGGMTAYPVPSGGLWWLVRCEGRRMRPPLTFAEARRDVESDIVKTGSAELRQLAMKQTSVRYYGMLGKTARAAAAQ